MPAMPVLNESLSFNHVPPGDRAAFVGKSARRTLLPADTELYKFTGGGIVPDIPGRPVSPWWASVRPLTGFPDLGLDGHLNAATAAGLTPLEYARQVFAVMLNWNTLGLPHLGLAKIERVRLRVPVYGFAGLCQRMRERLRPDQETRRLVYKTTPGGKTVAREAWRSPEHKPPVFRGGAVQLYIPNLTTADLQTVAAHLV